MIIPVFKPLGASSHRLAAKVGELFHEKATHTGTLDPMAEGVLIVLTGEDRFNKEKLSDVYKTYEFEILVGFSTDSHDLLGIITDHSAVTLSTESIVQETRDSFKKIRNNTAQIVPTFSAKRHAGKSGFDFGKNNQAIPMINQPVMIYSLELLSSREISATDLENNCIAKLKTVEGDFRQSEVISQWQTRLSCIKKTHFTVLKCIAITSKRVYIRGIVRDLATLLHLPCTTFSINRVRNGKYSQKDCICLL